VVKVYCYTTTVNHHRIKVIVVKSSTSSGLPTIHRDDYFITGNLGLHHQAVIGAVQLYLGVDGYNNVEDKNTQKFTLLPPEHSTVQSLL
jgi:hypothetical protein